MRLVVLLLFTAAISVPAVSDASTEGVGACPFLNRADAADAMEEEAVLEQFYEVQGDAQKCEFFGGPRKPAELPAKLRVVVNLDLRLFKLSRENMETFKTTQCKLANKGNYDQEACVYAKKAVKADDPLERFKLAHRSLLEMGDVSNRGGLGHPAFMVQFNPKLVGTELWVYLEKKKRAFVATCINDHTVGKGANGHFPACAVSAAREALETIAP